MAYKLNKTGAQVEEDLNRVEEKDIYPVASETEDGLMSKEHVERLIDVEKAVEEESESLTDEEITEICQV